MNVDDRDSDAGDEVTGQDLHVPGEHHELGVVAQQSQVLCLGRGLVRARGRHVEERDPEGAHLAGQIGVVGDDHGNGDRQFAVTLPPQQVEQAVIGLGREHRHPLWRRHVAQGELEAELLAEALSQVQLDPRQGHLEVPQAEDGALEERAALRVVRVLVERHDIRAVTGEHRPDGRHDSGTVLPLHDQRGVIPGHRGWRADPWRFMNDGHRRLHRQPRRVSLWWLGIGASFLVTSARILDRSSR